MFHPNQCCRSGDIIVINNFREYCLRKLPNLVQLIAKLFKNKYLHSYIQMQQKLFYTELNDEFNCTQNQLFEKVVLNHFASSRLMSRLYFQSDGKEPQSLPNLFHMLFGPSLTKLNQERLLLSDCLPAINANCQSFTNFLLTYNKKNAPLPLYTNL